MIAVGPPTVKRGAGPDNSAVAVTAATLDGIIDSTMATEIRAITEEELDRAHFILGYSFTADRSPETRMKHVECMGRSFALYEDGEMAACLRVLPLRMFLQGDSIALGGVSGVACLPEHRRKGYVGQLLRQALTVMREEGQPLSALHTPHPSLYRRYGWMVASSALLCRFGPKEIAPADAARPEGKAYRVTEEDWPAIAAIYKRFASPRNGYLDRDEHWWKEAVFRRIYDEKRRPNDIAVWTDGEGEPSGYLAYHGASEHRPDAPSTDTISITELVALGADAYAGLLRYLLAHDLAQRVTWWAPVDEPFALTIDEPDRVRREHHYGFMLCVVDVEKAIAARQPAESAPEGAITVQIADAAAPWNQGVWRIECSGGRMAATRANGTADLSTDAAAFAAMYNGFLRPSDAARSGLASVNDPNAAALADRILATDYAPHASEFF
jgi:predicted acetyltransferase